MVKLSWVMQVGLYVTTTDLREAEGDLAQKAEGSVMMEAERNVRMLCCWLSRWRKEP